MADDDLIGIVEDSSLGWSHQAITGKRLRAGQRRPVCCGCSAGRHALFKTDTPDIDEPALETIVKHAPDVEN